MTDPLNTAKIIEECRTEIQELRRELYGNPQARQKGVYERLDILEEKISMLKLKLEINNVYQRGIVWGGSAIIVSVIGAGLLALFRYLGGG